VSVAELRTSSPPVTGVLASTDACERVAGLPGACRVAPTEVAIVGDVSSAALLQAVRRLDPDAVVVDVSGGWVAHTLEGPGARDALSRMTELELPVSGFVQGEVARIGVRMLVDGDRIHLLVPSMHADHLRDRIRAACAELLR
jgi:sarcosine oxidase gamma subunit